METKKIIKIKTKGQSAENGKGKKSKSSRHLKVVQLKCFSEVHRRVIDGWNLDEVMSYIRENGEWKDVTYPYGRILLAEYRKSVPPGERVRATLPTSYMEALDELKVGVNEINEMVELYKIQKKRIMIDYGEEVKLNKLFKGTGFEIKVAAEIVNQILEKKMDLGIIQRRIGRLDIASVNIDVEVQAKLDEKYGRTIVTRVLNNPESRQKLLSIVDYLSIVADKDKEEKSEIEEVFEKGVKEAEEIIMEKKRKRGNPSWVKRNGGNGKVKEEDGAEKKKVGNPNWVKGMITCSKTKKERQGV